jgi:hypothetical protein
LRAILAKKCDGVDLVGKRADRLKRILLPCMTSCFAWIARLR